LRLTDESDHSAWTGTVRVAEFLGDAMEYQVDVEGNLLRARSHSLDGITRGARVKVDFVPDQVLIFPKEEDQALAALETDELASHAGQFATGTR
jgi:hypothetical protein